VPKRGYRRDAALSERARELSDGAREWYRRHGGPWLHVGGVKSLNLPDSSVDFDGVAFYGNRRRAAMLRAGAKLIGACRGGTPQCIRALSRAIDRYRDPL